jgi:hypothetical protein
MILIIMKWLCWDVVGKYWEHDWMWEWNLWILSIIHNSLLVIVSYEHNLASRNVLVWKIMGIIIHCDIRKSSTIHVMYYYVLLLLLFWMWKKKWLYWLVYFDLRMYFIFDKRKSMVEVSSMSSVVTHKNMFSFVSQNCNSKSWILGGFQNNWNWQSLIFLSFQIRN